MITSFAATAATWQNFYILTGTAAATLVGLMFVAVTFGSNLVTDATSQTARAFLDPTFTHFVQVLVTACLITVPTMAPMFVGIAIIAISLFRGSALVRIHGHMRVAQSRANDIELSDWLSGLIIPAITYATLAVAGVGFIMNYAFAFDALAIGTVAILLNGIYGAWELMVWLALMRSRAAK